jgi:AcrR family transcriptional regulator
VTSGSATRDHILGVAKRMLAESGSNSFRIDDVATEASVGIHTIYYHFGNRALLIAEAQLCAYAQMTEKLESCVNAALEALSEGDEERFWSALSSEVIEAWTIESGGEGWRVVRLLVDIRTDDKSRLALSKRIEAQFLRWSDVLERGMERGWVDKEVNLRALATSCWAGSMGQFAFSGLEGISISPETMRDFYLSLLKARR